MQMLPYNNQTQSFEIITTAPYACSYIPFRLAQSEIINIHRQINKTEFSFLLANGFRRSGEHIYRPACHDCGACISLRIKAQHFRLSRNQKRTFAQHQNLRVQQQGLIFNEEHFKLYCKYQSIRHPETSNEQDNLATYQSFILKSRTSSYLIEFYEPQLVGVDLLKMVSVVDVHDDGLSAVYTFYDPSPGASYGSYAIMWQIQYVQSLDLPYLYLGYWIESSPKMRYKSRFGPHELFINNQWVDGV